MAIAARPAAYVIDTGAELCPDHLYLCDEGTGAALTDKGKGSSLVNATITGADWIVDGVHGNALDFVSANSDYATIAGLLGITTQATVVLICAVDAVVSAAGTLMGTGRSGAANRYCHMRYTNNGTFGAETHDGTTLDQYSITGSTQIDDAAYKLIAFKVKSSESGISLNGGAFTIDATAMTYPDSHNQVRIGARAIDTPALFADMTVVAIAVYSDVYLSDAQISTLYNSENPWPILGLNTDPSISGIAPDPIDYSAAYTVSGVNFSASGNTLTIGGVSQTISSHGVAACTVNAPSLGALLFGQNYDAILTTSGAVATAAFPIPFTVPADEAYWDLGTLGATATQLLTAIPDLVNGAQIHGLELRDATATPIDITLVTIELDGSISLDASITDPTGYELDVRANNRDGEGWGAVATVTLTVSLGEAAPAHGARMATLGGIMVR